MELRIDDIQISMAASLARAYLVLFYLDEIDRFFYLAFNKKKF